LVAGILIVGSLVITAGGVALGYETSAKPTRPNPIRLRDGVPVGVLDTPDGALAAADNYVASEDNALLSPDSLRRVVNAVWAPAERSVELAQPFPAAALAGKPGTFSGLKLTAAVAADKLEAFTPRTAQVGVWHELTIWSPSVEPTQRWSDDTLTLVWDSGRWLIASRSAVPDAVTPVPAWTSGAPADRTSQAFDARLAGMSAPFYGAAER
jgi:hypothetical protein